MCSCGCRISAQVIRGKVAVVVPFYRFPKLVDQMVVQLQRLREEWDESVGTLILVNDSPGDVPLQQALQRARAALQEGWPLEIIEQPVNLGFVAAANRGLVRAQQLGMHALVLNSDVTMALGALTEMLAVLALDPRIGFVNPRSNCATLCDLPIGGETGGCGDSVQAEAAHRALAVHLPPWHVVPTGNGFCLLVAAMVLQEIGVFDPIYGRGYNEENDLVCRANRCGFIAVLANHAFAYHRGSVSFGAQMHARLERRHATILERRWPEYRPAVRAYFSSPNYKFESLISAAYLGATVDGRLRLLVDCSRLEPTHNGTFRAMAQLVRAMAAGRQIYATTLCCPSRARAFHGLDLLGDSVQCIDEVGGQVYDLYLRIGQPFSVAEFVTASSCATRLFFVMLDSIAWDCAYLRGPDLDLAWQLVAEHADGVLFNSAYTQACFNRRFVAVRGRPQTVCGHSLALADYLPVARPAIERSGLPGTVRRTILVLGNAYAHKFVQPTVAAILRTQPQADVIAQGLTSHADSRVRTIGAGSLSAEAMEALWDEADLVVFPSLYEGFGFPLLEALARDKVIFVRDSSLVDEICRGWNGPSLPLRYRTTAELMAALTNWQAGQAPPASPIAHRPTFGWPQVAQSIQRHIGKCLVASPDLQTTRARLNAVSAVADGGSVLRREMLRWRLQLAIRRHVGRRFETVLLQLIDKVRVKHSLWCRKSPAPGAQPFDGAAPLALVRTNALLCSGNPKSPQV